MAEDNNKREEIDAEVLKAISSVQGIEKTPIQTKLIGSQITQAKEFSEILRLISFGTPLRMGIEKVAQARTGGLIGVGNEDVLKIIRGGFNIDCKFTSNRVAELSKMDGAIILNNKMSRILYAGTLLVPDPDIKTNETGSRHQAAERTAKQTGQLVIAISQRTGIATVYYGSLRYRLKKLDALLSTARSTIDNLRKYRKIVDELISKLNVLEIMGFSEIYDVALALQRIEIVSRIEKEVRKQLIELGKESGLLEMEFKELTKDIEKECLLIIRDYKNKVPTKRIRKYLAGFSYDSLLDLKNIVNVLGYDNLDEKVLSRGYRFLSKIKSLSPLEAENITKKFRLSELFDVNLENFKRNCNLDEKDAFSLLEEIKKLKNELLSKL